jgi:hypothetical protein
LNRFNLPGREGRAGYSDFTQGDEKASIKRLGNGAKHGPSRR